MKIQFRPSYKQEPACSFCTRRQRECHFLFVGVGAYICDNCVLFCEVVIEDALASTRIRFLPRPRQGWVCSFCGGLFEGRIISGMTGFICYDCVEERLTIIRESKGRVALPEGA